MKYWKKLTAKQIKDRVFDALNKNIDFEDDLSIGIPASHLDGKVFFSHAPYLEDAPFLNTLVHNPNHIGCHTLGESEEFFEGTHDIEREAIKILAEDLLRGGEDEQDGYIASGGTEANIQACCDRRHPGWRAQLRRRRQYRRDHRPALPVRLLRRRRT